MLSRSYAGIAGTLPSNGLYSALFAMLSYPFFGTSAHLISGPTAVMSIIVKDSVPASWNGVPLEEGTLPFAEITHVLGRP